MPALVVSKDDHGLLVRAGEALRCGLSAADHERLLDIINSALLGTQPSRDRLTTSYILQVLETCLDDGFMVKLTHVLGSDQDNDA